MNNRKQTGKKAGYLCSGLVYCANCGAKMHGVTTHRKEHEYKVYYCSEHCGVGTVKMDDIDSSVREYIKNLLSEENTKIITEALKKYSSNETDRVKEFNDSVAREIKEKQKQIDNYMATLGSGVLPSEIISDIGNKIVTLKEEIKGLQTAEPPKDFTVPQIQVWLQSIRSAPDDKAVRLLIERIDANKTDINIQSTLKSVLGDNGCGGRI